MYLKIKKLEMVPDKYGKHIKITMIGLYNHNGDWVKWVSLEEAAVLYENAKIPYNG